MPGPFPGPPSSLAAVELEREEVRASDRDVECDGRWRLERCVDRVVMEMVAAEENSAP